MMPQEKTKEKPPRTKFHKIRTRIRKIFDTVLWRSSHDINNNKLKTHKHNVYKGIEIADDDAFVENFDALYEKTLADIMVTRSDIFAVNFNTTLSALAKAVVQSTHTRTLVYENSLDNIIGFIHIKDLFKIISTKGAKRGYDIRKLLRPHIIAPHSMKLINLLHKMQQDRTHIAVVVDEYGGTDGILTIEDIMEEVFGNIDDEHDKATNIKEYRMLSDGILITSARVGVEELENLLSINLKNENDEFDTIGGLVMSKSGNVPAKGDVIDIGNKIKIEILDATPRILKQLKVICNEKIKHSEH